MSDQTGTNFVRTIRHDTYPAIDPSKADLTDKVVLISGASKGIGKATAIAFAQAGVSGLVLFARSDLTTVTVLCQAAQRPGQSLTVLPISTDTTDATQVSDAVAKIKATFGRLDIVVNNAGYMEPFALLADQDPEEWWKVWEVNVRGTYLVTRACIPLLIESGGDKTIVNLVSKGALQQVPSLSSYQTSKFAMLRFTEFIVAEYGNQGVLSYAVHPGTIVTDMAISRMPNMLHVLIDTLELAAHTIV